MKDKELSAKMVYQKGNHRYFKLSELVTCNCDGEWIRFDEPWREETDLVCIVDTPTHNERLMYPATCIDEKYSRSIHIMGGDITPHDNNQPLISINNLISILADRNHMNARMGYFDF